MRNTLVVAEPLAGALLNWDYPEEERIKYGLLGVSEGAGERRLLLREVISPALEDYSRRGPASAATRAEFVFNVYQQAWNRGLPGIAFVHTHPCSAFFSGTDRADAGRHRGLAFDFARCYVQLVVGSHGLVGLLHLPDGGTEPIHRIVRIKARGIEVVLPENAPRPGNAGLDRERHRRTLEVGGGVEAALALVRELRWGLIGAGGGGAAFLNSFKFLGPRHLVLVDPQRLERSNANRFMGYRHDDDGRPKVEVLKRELLAFDPSVEVEAIEEAFPSAAADIALKTCDVLVTVPDHHWVRLQAAAFAARHLQVLLEGGAGIHASADGTPYRISCTTRLQLPPSLGPCLRCLGVRATLPPLYEALVAEAQRSYVKGPAQGGLTPASVVTLLAQLGALLSRHLLYFLSPLGGDGAALPRYLVYDEIPLTLQDLSPLWSQVPECPICGAAAPWGYGDAAPTLPAPPELEIESEPLVSDAAVPGRQPE